MFFIKEFTQKVKEKENAFAITDDEGKRSLSYRELDVISDKIANKLIRMGVKSGDSVIIVLPRCIEYVAAEIALLKIGAVVVPLIPEYPVDRVSYIEKDSGANLIIREDFFENIDSEDEKLVDLSDIGNDEKGMILYTSGSTGRPKGVIYSRGNIDAQIIRKCKNVRDIEPLVFAASATMSFCVTVSEYFRTLILGGHIHIISNEVRSDAEKLSGYYINNHITSGFISPRILRNFKCKSDCLKRVFTASEKVVNIYSDDFEIMNCYGQSETIGTITYFLIDRPYDNTPIGIPEDGIDIVIVDSDNNEVPDGTEGQICIIGNLPCEYNNLPDQTDEVFKKLPDGRTFIFSGDIGKKLPDGNVLYLNRNDWMIKIHGQRVEPGEIESVMNTTQGVSGSIVKAFDNDDGTMLLCGFYTENKPVEKSAIKNALEAKLPHYMIPGVFVRMEAFPVNANGKIDRKSIARPDFNLMRTGYEKPKDETEEAICNAMQKVLNLKQIGRNDNFFELGGNSLNAVNLCALCSIEGMAPQIVMIGQTAAKIAELIAGKSFYPKPALTVSKEIRQKYPLSLSQRYQNSVCTSLGTTIDVIDMTYYFKLSKSVDIDRLKAAVERVVNEHPIYKCQIDIDGNSLLVDKSDFCVTEVNISADEFEKYRNKRYKRVRNLKEDPLFEAELIHLDDESTYLFMCLCHLIYDGKSTNNLLACISAYYNEEDSPSEEASIFDLIDYEAKLKDDKELIKRAEEVFEDNYGSLKPYKLFEEYENHATGFSMPILKDIKQEDIDAYLKKYGISILTLFQMAFEVTVGKVFKTNDFCYMNVYDGRGNKLLNNAHGVFAKSVFMRSGLNKYNSLTEYQRAIEKQYQRLVYYDVLDTFLVVDRYPAIKSGMTLNYREAPSMSLKLGDEKIRSEYLEEFFTVNKPFTAMDFMINRFPNNLGYSVAFASAKVSGEFGRNFVNTFDSSVCELLRGGEDGIYR